MALPSHRLHYGSGLLKHAISGPAAQASTLHILCRSGHSASFHFCRAGSACRDGGHPSVNRCGSPALSRAAQRGDTCPTFQGLLLRDPKSRADCLQSGGGSVPASAPAAPHALQTACRAGRQHVAGHISSREHGARATKPQLWGLRYATGSGPGRPGAPSRRPHLLQCAAAQGPSSRAYETPPRAHFASVSAPPPAPSATSQSLHLAAADRAILFLGFIACAVTGALALFILAALPALKALRKAAEALEKLADTAREELPGTMAAVRLSGMEISDLTMELSDLSQEISDGVRSSARAVQVAEQGLRHMGSFATSQTLGARQRPRGGGPPGGGDGSKERPRGGQPGALAGAPAGSYPPHLELAK